LIALLPAPLQRTAWRRNVHYLRPMPCNVYRFPKLAMEISA
jgi:hypothetical protein